MEVFKNLRIPTPDERLAWFRGAKFGMFVHWGIYAQLAGSWKGKEIPNIGEQIMRFGEIPRKEYRAVAKDFNPVNFNAKDWVSLAKSAGMRYIVITAKHHDGFAMYHSKVSAYNIIDATPYDTDPMKELAQACKESDIKLCFYYSHRQDWDHVNGFVNEPLWDSEFLQPENQVFEQYMNEKAIPQVVELLTNYGEVGLIWYDTPGVLSDYNAKRFANIVHAIQPNCIVSPRVSNNPTIGDYIGYSDNQVPSSVNPLPWETCATMNDTWGFKEQDKNWKSTSTLLRLLVSIVSKGGNYLLNVGPTKLGEIPPESVERLKEIGEWMRENSNSIHDTQGGILRQNPEWGAATAKGNRLFLHLFQWKSGDFVFTGLNSKVMSVKLHVSGEVLTFEQTKTDTPSISVLTINLPETAPDKHISVIEVELEDSLDITEIPNDQESCVLLNGYFGNIRSLKEPTLHETKSGILECWKNTDDWIEWEVAITQAGTFDVVLNTFSERYPDRVNPNWEGDHSMTLSNGSESLDFVVTDHARTYPRDNFHWQNITTNAGKINFPAAGTYTLALKANKINYAHELGPKIKSISLTRQSLKNN